MLCFLKKFCLESNKESSFQDFVIPDFKTNYSLAVEEQTIVFTFVGTYLLAMPAHADRDDFAPRPFVVAGDQTYIRLQTDGLAHGAESSRRPTACQELAAGEVYLGDKRRTECAHPPRLIQRPCKTQIRTARP